MTSVVSNRVPASMLELPEKEQGEEEPHVCSCNSSNNNTSPGHRNAAPCPLYFSSASHKGQDKSANVTPC